jgi:hypothetical protein
MSKENPTITLFVATVGDKTNCNIVDAATTEEFSTAINTF